MGIASESIQELARALSKDGAGEALRFTEIGAAQSAAYNKLASAANGVINTMGADEAQAIRKIIKEGEEFGTKEFEDALAKMSAGDDAARKIAEDFSTLRSKYDDIDTKSIESYAEFLGRENGKLGVKDIAGGYFLDKANGKTRRIAAAGAAVGVGVAGRVLSGGSLTRTNTGERDIAGVPFI